MGIHLDNDTNLIFTKRFMGLNPSNIVVKRLHESYAHRGKLAKWADICEKAVI